MSTAVMPQNAMYEFGDIIIKVGFVFVCAVPCDLLLADKQVPTLRRCQPSLKSEKRERARGASRFFHQNGCSLSRGHRCSWLSYVIAKKSSRPRTNYA